MSVTGRYELHCHLDGSVRLTTLEALAEAAGLRFATPVRRLAVAPAGVGSLHAFLPYIDIALAVLQTRQSLERVATELVHDWHTDGVVYGEVRFAPQLHTRHGLTIDEVIAAVDSGLRRGSAETGVTTGLLLCCLRHQSPETSIRVAEAAVRNRPTVVGLDLAGDERLPGAPHREAFDIAHAAGMAVTVHAGEGAGPASVWEAIDLLGASRIGHGVRSIEDPALLARLRTDRVALETCPRCNVLTRAVPSLHEHPAHRLLVEGLRVTISTDTRTTARTTLNDEFRAMQRTFGWGEPEHDEVQAHARAAAFGSAPDPAPAAPPTPADAGVLHGRPSAQPQK